jgi:hypothetical protein
MAGLDYALVGFRDKAVDVMVIYIFDAAGKFIQSYAYTDMDEKYLFRVEKSGRYGIVVSLESSTAPLATLGFLLAYAEPGTAQAAK